MDDHSIGIIWSREGVQQGDVLATFLFANVFAPILGKIYTRVILLCPSFQLFAILDDITMTAPVHLLGRMFQICTEELAMVNIRTVPRKTRILIVQHDLQHVLVDLDS